jgi:hypothetical protein
VGVMKSSCTTINSGFFRALTPLLVFSHWFKRLQQPVFGVQDFPLGKSPGAGFQTPSLFIRLNFLHQSLRNMNLEKTAGPAIEGAGGGENPLGRF